MKTKLSILAIICIAFSGPKLQAQCQLDSIVIGIADYPDSIPSFFGKLAYDYDSGRLQVMRFYSLDNNTKVLFESSRQKSFYNTDGKIRQVDFESRDDVNATWRLNGSIKHTYSTGNEEILRTNWNFANSRTDSTNLEKITYNTDGSISVSIIQDRSNYTWVNSQRITNSYQNSLLSVKTIENWDIQDLKWVNRIKYNYTYTNGKETINDYSIWDNDLMQWNKYARVLSTYNSAGLKSYAKMEFWNGTSYQNENLETFVYDKNGCLQYYIYEADWDTDLGLFKFRQAEYHYNSKTVGLNLPEINATNVFPNPALNEVNVNLMHACAYTLLDFNGRALDSGNLSKGSNKLDISNLPQGIYSIILNGASYKISILR